ncbi:relaxase domain-containing protein [Microbacterium oleivorans]|uniref:relaxase domain-containing protein n=1 Tax=Microbacterium oleivorans TaxID=273677 RepID=UPI0013778D20|nr:relaxase domain-containing protein [Microbacterium oleivorans]
MGRDELDASALRRWIQGEDPKTGESRGPMHRSENTDLLLDGTINFPKSYSVAALLDPELAQEFELLQDRMRDRTILLWQRELNARRGRGGRIRGDIARLEVVELQHRRSRALDPHIHRHLWLNMKVQGADGKWSSLDSRVALKLHNVVNAEGELAARSDPRWVSALAAHGYTLDANGEIAQLAHVVRPLSRRSNQIEANRIRLISEWREEHLGRHPASMISTTSTSWRGLNDDPASLPISMKPSGRSGYAMSSPISTPSCFGSGTQPGSTPPRSPTSIAICSRGWRSSRPTLVRSRAAAGSRPGICVPAPSGPSPEAGSSPRETRSTS